MPTVMYLGDGVYGEFDGYNITLRANGDGVHTPATDTVVLEPSVMLSLNNWMGGGYPDYNTGKKFNET